MTIPRWTPRLTVTKQEEFVLGRLHRTRKLFAFLRLHRLDIFDDVFQDELATMYRDDCGGKEPLPPALLAMVVLLQAYLRTSDAEAVELAIMDRRWQLVLDCAGAEAPIFSQGALHDFRERLIRTNMDQRLLARTVAVARNSGVFDSKKLPTSLRVAMDSRPLEGAGRVEDTINLLGHAARKIVSTMAKWLDVKEDVVCAQANTPLFAGPSIKAALDIDWSNAAAKRAAVTRLDHQVEALCTWVEAQLKDVPMPPSRATDTVVTLKQLRVQDLEPDGQGGVQIRDGVAPDRRISVEDGEMRHGRKSATKRFNGFKQHVVTDLDTRLVVAVDVTPGNRPDADAAPVLHAEVKRQGFEVNSLYIDLGYLASPTVVEVTGNGGVVVCKPWPGHRAGDLFPKAAFKINVRDRTVTCPAGETIDITFGAKAKFDGATCGACALRPQCTNARPGVGREIYIAPEEPLQQRLRKRAATRGGRAALRERVGVEHTLGRVAQRQGARARYRGVRRNLFDLRRVAAIQNLEIWHQAEIEAELAMAA
jgi:hypothetical protein